jgi:hypothetical protein
MRMQEKHWTLNYSSYYDGRFLGQALGDRK